MAVKQIVIRDLEAEKKEQEDAAGAGAVVCGIAGLIFGGPIGGLIGAGLGSYLCEEGTKAQQEERYK